MPRAPRFRTSALGELFAQVRYAAAEMRRQQMDRAEALAGEINEDGAYPDDFVRFRITGYRSDSGEEPAVLVGAALLADLGIYVQRTSRELRLPLDDTPRTALTLEEVQQRLGVSQRTLQRYRRRGLICHELVGPDGVQRLHCFEDALEAFRRKHADELRRASSFSRLSDGDRERLIDEARALHRAEGLTLHQAAQRLAPSWGRAPETLRGLLKRHDRRGDTPIFRERGPLGEGGDELVFRAWRFGVPPARIAKRLGKAPTTIHHAIHRMRRRRLVELDVRWVALPTFDRPDAESVILEAAPLHERMDLELAAEVRRTVDDPPKSVDIDEVLEDALLAGYNLLKRRVRGAVDALPAYPSSGDLDLVETDLRWAAAIKRRLVVLTLPAALRAVDQHLHRRLLEEPTETVQRLVRLAVEVASASVERIDPSRQRLARFAAFSMDRSLARAPARPPSRAAARRADGTPVLVVPGRAPLCPWQTWLDPPRRLRVHLDELPPPWAALVRERYGWSGRAPQTLAALAAARGMTVATTAARLRAAERRAARASRRRRTDRTEG